MVARILKEAKGQLPGVRVEEVDVTAQPAIAVKYQVMATPAIAVNGTLAFHGVPRADALLAALRAAAADATAGG